MIKHALKDIENRGWPINYRGDILIHAAKTCTKKEYQLAREFCQGMGVVIPELISLRRGQVIGIVTTRISHEGEKNTWISQT
ncbi:MAG: hypothetical protein V7K67_24015 [Nostoc sp.]|uniref:hypothetical protein n=1 Tax=Nostoc sp. TaxID=1180 RepID=UPI002FFCA1BB